MEKNNEEGKYLSQAEIDAIIDEIIENEPVPAVKEHLKNMRKNTEEKETNKNWKNTN